MSMPFASTRQLPPIRRGQACARALDTTTITTTGTRTIAPWGQATFRKVGSDVWLASGMGVA